MLGRSEDTLGDGELGNDFLKWKEFSRRRFSYDCLLDWDKKDKNIRPLE